MIEIPNVTLVIPTTRAHDLARITVLDLVSKVNFGGGVLIYTDDCDRLAVPGARYIKVADWPDKNSSSLFYYTEAALGVETSHALLMEWDGGVCDPAMWRDEFLQYDYIGAPWSADMGDPRHNSFTVGNGGFALISKRLVEFCHDAKLKIYTDMHISRHHRPELEAQGFKWAPENVARDFSYEGWTRRGPIIPTERPHSFGYHCVTNWPAILTRADLLTRGKILVAGPHGRDKINLLLRAAPWLSPELGVPMPSRRQYPQQSIQQLQNTQLIVDRIRAQRAAAYAGMGQPRKA